MAKTILVVDDDKDIRQSLIDALEALGCVGVGASNGQEALEVLSKIEPPTLIILDLMMPIMNGWQFRTMQQNDPKLAQIPVVIFSADGSIQQKGSAMGADGFLKKPVDFESLEKLTRKFC